MPRSLANCRAKMETPPVPWMRTVESGLRLAATERVPGGDGGAGECGGFFEAEMVGNADEAGLFEQDVFSEHAVDVAAERAFDVGGSGRAVEPVLHEDGRDAVAGLPCGDAVADGGDFAGAVGAGNARKPEFGVVEALDHHQIAIIQRDGTNFNEHFAGAGCGRGALDKLKRINAEGRDLPNAHGGGSDDGRCKCDWMRAIVVRNLQAPVK